jgi:hypothetical protein
MVVESSVLLWLISDNSMVAQAMEQECSVFVEIRRFAGD